MLKQDNFQSMFGAEQCVGICTLNMLALKAPGNGGCLQGGDLGFWELTMQDLLYITQPSIQCQFVYSLPMLPPPSLIKIHFIHTVSSEPKQSEEIEDITTSILLVTKLRLRGSRVFSQGLTAGAELKLEPRSSGSKSHVLPTCLSHQPLNG